MANLTSLLYSLLDNGVAVGVQAALLYDGVELDWSIGSRFPGEPMTRDTKHNSIARLRPSGPLPLQKRCFESDDPLTPSGRWIYFYRNYRLRKAPRWRTS